MKKKTTSKRVAENKNINGKKREKNDGPENNRNGGEKGEIRSNVRGWGDNTFMQDNGRAIAPRDTEISPLEKYNT